MDMEGWYILDLVDYILLLIILFVYKVVGIIMKVRSCFIRLGLV